MPVLFFNRMFSTAQEIGISEKDVSASLANLP